MALSWLSASTCAGEFERQVIDSHETDDCAKRLIEVQVAFLEVWPVCECVMDVVERWVKVDRER